MQTDESINMIKRDIIRIILLALVVGNIMGIVLIQIFGEFTLLKLLQLDVSLIVIIGFLFIASRMWNNRLKSRKKKTMKQHNNDDNNSDDCQMRGNCI